MITIEKVNKYFNRHKKNQIHVINNTNLNFEKEGLVALLGPSGSGKTTLLNVIGGLDKVNNGKIFIDGKRITQRNFSKIDKIRNLNIGYIFQDYKLIDNMTVFDNIALVLKMIGIKDKKEIKKRVNYVLEILNIYRYRNRYANMLSGGERQRVGIARAIVKDPNIIIADEPTGNLDSKNTLEIMNIIKSISKSRLVILVTHESDLAKFYASRIIELKDGKIEKDYNNENAKELDYRLENNIYLKDFKSHCNLSQKNINVECYSDGKEIINLDIVVKNGNFYIKSKNNEKIEIINENSGIELINDNYRKIDKSVYQEYEFNFSEIINKSVKKRYSSILNLFSLIVTGFKKVINYSLVKKLLLLGFFASSMFILMSLSSIFGTINIEDKDFLIYNKDYLQITLNKLNVKDYLEYEKTEGVKYMMPGDSLVTFNILFDDYYQTLSLQDYLLGSLSSTALLKETDIKYGRMPENNYEIVIDSFVAEKMFSNYNAKQAGINKPEQLLERDVTLENMKPFKIVGITDMQNPAIYTPESQFINIISNSNSNNIGYASNIMIEDKDYETGNQFIDYNTIGKEITLKKGSWPKNDYEVVVNYNNRDSMPLNKKIDTIINKTKLKVVGYFTSTKEDNQYLISPNTLKYSVIENASNITLYSEDKPLSINTFREKGLNINSTYDLAKNAYMESIQDSIISTLVVSGIVIAISLIEIFLMIRSSFLSRIKEIGIYRAIGVKKSDIYKMFIGEIIAITFIACLSGITLMSYILYVLCEIPLIASSLMINPYIIGLAILICFVFNMLIGLIPIFNTLCKTPAQILARHDLE